MAIDILVRPLLSLPIFHGLPTHRLEDIARSAERITYRPGTVIAAENATSDAAIIIISGTCIRLNDESGSFQGEELSPGSMIAELAMLIDIIHPSTVMARDNVRAMRLTRHHTLGMMQRDPMLAEHFSARVLARLKSISEDLKQVDAEIARTLAPPPKPQAILASGAVFERPRKASAAKFFR